MDASMLSSASPSMSEPLDMDLYSRQLGTYGLETMKRLVAARYLISGLQGAGAEIAKNLILAGPGQVTLNDNTIVDWPDLGSNFCLKETDVGKRSRARASIDFLQTLNPYVAVTVEESPLSDQILKNYDCVILCNYTKNQLKEMNRVCRLHNVKCIAVGVYGLCVSLFVDFGKSFVVTDVDGEEPKTSIIESIVVAGADKLVINCTDDKRVPYSVGDFVSFSEVVGMDTLNTTGPFQITGLGKHSFNLELDTRALQPYRTGGLVRQVKQSRTLSFRSYTDACNQPIAEGEFCLTTPDLAKFGRSEQLHIALQALLDYESIHEAVPEPRDSAAVEEIYEIAVKLNKKFNEEKQVEGVVCVDEVDKDVVRNVASFALCHLNPAATFIGGVVAQEAIKITGRYTPIHQWLYFDFFELLDTLEINPADCQPIGSRYDDQIIIWGSKIQERLAQSRVFLVGAGALGCEYLKNLALIGCGTGPDGLVTVTDMDRIEVSNLNRQFLFRREHVGRPKSMTAGQMVKAMNSSLHIKAIETRVGVDTETELNDAFWDGLDVIVNALDNVPSRLYVDSKCVWHCKPLLESGTLGVKGNVQVVVPRMTESYGDARDPPEEAIPLCTLRHFPNQIEHTIEWGRDLFQGTFQDALQEASNVKKNASAAFVLLKSQSSPNDRRKQLERIYTFIRMTVPQPSFEACVVWAVTQFQDHFHDFIVQLLHSFPADHVTSEGAPFWSGPKRCPKALTLDLSDETERTFILAASNLCAVAMGIPENRNVEEVIQMAQKVELPKFQPKVITFKTSDNEPNVVEGSNDDEEICEKLERQILEILPEAVFFNPQPIEFEKDDDTNFHIDFMASVGNLRARNYNIPEIERWKAKMIAGKIIPAIATTTAMTTGLATLELLKVITREKRPIEHFKNAFVNLASPIWILSEPAEPKKAVDVDYDPICGGPMRSRPAGFTSWDKVEVNLKGTQTLKDMIDAIQRELSTEVALLSVGNICLYNSFQRSHQEKLKLSLNEVVLQMSKQTPEVSPSKNYMAVQASCSDEDGTDVNVPTIKVNIGGQ